MLTSFVPDVVGTYVVQLIVNDGCVNSNPSTVEVEVISIKTEAIEAAQNLEVAIASLNPAAFKNRNMPNALINKLNAVIANISDGNYSGRYRHGILTIHKCYWGVRHEESC